VISFSDVQVKLVNQLICAGLNVFALSYFSLAGIAQAIALLGRLLGVPEKGDAHWLDHQGSYMATVAAQPVWELLGAKGVGPAQDYRTAKMPGVNVGLLDGELAWRQHDGGHTDAPNMKYFIAWVDRKIGYSPPS